MRVALVEDSVVVRQSLASALVAAGFEVVAQAGDVAGALEAVAATVPDVVVIDLQLSDSRRDSGLLVAERIAAEHPAVGLLVLSGHADDEFVDRLVGLRPHGRGYALKSNAEGLPAFFEAVRRVGTGRNYLDEEIQERLLTQRREGRGRAGVLRPEAPLAELSPYELRILELISDHAMTNAAIARELKIKVNTVEKRISKIFEKLQFSRPDVADRDRNARVLAALLYQRFTRR